MNPFTSQYLSFTPLSSQYLKSYLCPPIHPCVHSSLLLQFSYPGEGYLRVSQLSIALYTVTLFNRPLYLHPYHTPLPWSEIFDPWSCGACVTAFRRGVIFVGRGWQREVLQLSAYQYPLTRLQVPSAFFPGVIWLGAESPTARCRCTLASKI